MYIIHVCIVTVIAGCVLGLVILAILIIIAAFLIVTKSKRTDRTTERIHPDAAEEEGPDDEIDGIKKHAPTHTSDEQERLLRQRVQRGERSARTKK